MDIDYTAIITNANARKDRLLNLAAQLEQAPEMVKMLQEIHVWAIQVADTYRALDDEGRALLPHPIRLALNFATTSAEWLKRAEYEPMGGFSSGIRAWSQNV